MVGGLGFLGAVLSTPWKDTDAVVTSWSGPAGEGLAPGANESTARYLTGKF